MDTIEEVVNTTTDNIVMLVSELTDEFLAITVVCGTMVSYFVGVDVPIEFAAGVLAFYFLRKKEQ